MNFEMGKKLRWIKGDNIDIVETIIKGNDENYIYFESGQRINPNVINEFMIEDDGISILDNLNPNFVLDTTPIKEEKNSEIALLFKGKNISNKKVRFEHNFNFPTDFIIKGLLLSIGYNEVEPVLIKMIKNQILQDVNFISKNIVQKLIKK